MMVHKCHCLQAHRQVLVCTDSQILCYRTGRTYVPEFGTRTKIEVLVPDSLAQQIVQSILTSLSTGSAADGKLFVKDVAEAYDIGTKQSGEVAL